MKSLRLFLCLILVALLGSCKENDDVLSEIDDSTTSRANQWIYKCMKANYLWNDEIGDLSDYDVRIESEFFFNSLLSQKEYKTPSGGVPYCYSYMKRTVNKVSSNGGKTYGMELVVYKLSDGLSVYGRVLYVLPGSPADLAGIKRGHWIVRKNREKINYEDKNSLKAGEACEFTVIEGVMGSGDDVVTVKKIAAAVEAVENPVLAYRVHELSGKRIGYLCYTSFANSESGDPLEWEQELRESFGYLKSAGVKEMILDLRYNSGGSLNTSLLLASMLVNPIHYGKTYCKIKFNDRNSSNNRDYAFESKWDNYNLALDRVYILVTGQTASASEAVINGLRANGIMDVVLIGTKTEGKNLGSVAFSNSIYGLELHPIVSSLSNGDGFGDYSMGFTPEGKYYYDELAYDDLNKFYPDLGELGSLQDGMVRVALVDMGVVPAYWMAPVKAKVSGEGSIELERVGYLRASMRPEGNEIDF